VAPALGSVQNRLDPSCPRRASSSTPALASRSPNASLLLTAPTMPIGLLQGQSRAPDSLPYFLVQYPILNALSHHHSKPDRRRTTSESLATRSHTETPSPSQKPTSLATPKKGKKNSYLLNLPRQLPVPPSAPLPFRNRPIINPPPPPPNLPPNTPPTKARTPIPVPPPAQHKRPQRPLHKRKHHLVPYRDVRDFPVRIGILYTRQVALLETEVWEGREGGAPRDWFEVYGGGGDGGV
jgi:hypothetical protein